MKPYRLLPTRQCPSFFLLRGMSAAAMLFMALFLTGCKPSAANSSDTQQTSEAANNQHPDSATAVAATANDTIAQPAADAQTVPTFLTFEQAKTMVSPGHSLDEAAIEAIFDRLQLPKVAAERYIWDADFGGNSPAISYTWGHKVAFKDWELKPSGADYYGVHFNFFFDKTRKTGTLKQITIIGNQSGWYEQFMADAKAAGLTFTGPLDKAVYQREGKEYMLKTGEETMYFINDFSANGAYEIEFGFDNGIDV